MDESVAFPFGALDLDDDQEQATSSAPPQPKKGDEERTCVLCGDKFTYKTFKQHKNTETHRLARMSKKRKKRKEKLKRKVQKAESIVMPVRDIEVEKINEREIRGLIPNLKKYKIPEEVEDVNDKEVRGDPDSDSLLYDVGSKEEEKVHRKETYNIRCDQNKNKSREQKQPYQNALTSLLALRFCLSSDNKEVKISMNNAAWNQFGDTVIEVSNEKTTKIFAIQCKKVQSRSDISISALSAEEGTFSIRQQSEILSHLREMKNYDKTYFKLFTVSNLKFDNNLEFTYDDEILNRWKDQKNLDDKSKKVAKTPNKDIWRGRKVKVVRYSKKCLIDTTDDPDNICIIKIFNHNDELLDQDLCKFSLYVNQNRAGFLKSQIRMIIKDKFDNKRDVSHDMVKYVEEYFQTKQLDRYKYKMTKRDILLKMAELILAPYMLFPESTTEARLIETWDETVQKFDITVIKNHPDISNKIYSSINHVLKTKICKNMDSSRKSLKIYKKDIEDEALKSEIFDGFFENYREVSLTYLYITLWKTQLAPLVLTVNKETGLPLITKIITFLKTENISLKYIVMTDFKAHQSYFPGNLKTFTCLKDLQKFDDEFLKGILDKIKISVFELNVSLKYIVDLNMGFLSKVTPETFLNMSLQEFSFKNLLVPRSDDIIDNTFVFDDELISKIRHHFQKHVYLSYMVNVKGNPIRIEIPPDI